MSLLSWGTALLVTLTGVPAVVSGPVTGGVHDRPFFPSLVRPGAYGYTEKEYFLSGVARAYGVTLPRAAYTTRIVVYRPRDPRRFSGTAFLEWNNVTLQADVPVEFTWAYPQVFAQGDAYVQVTAQQVGVCGPGLSGASIALCNPLSLKGADPVRYRSMVHPGDDYSYDIFSQAARVVRHPRGLAPLGGLHVRRLIAVGESQSSAALDLYMRYGADRDARLFDAFLIDGDAHLKAPRSYRVPTLHLWSEESAQPVETTAASNHRIWMVAGASHIDRWAIDQALPQLLRSATTGGVSTSKSVNAQLRRTSGDYGQHGPNLSSACVGGSEFPRRYVVDAAMAALKRWTAGGTPAPSAPTMRFTAGGTVVGQLPTLPHLPGLPADGLNLAGLLTAPLALERDANGNARGGLRLPVVRVPVARYDGTGCLLLGTSTTLDASRLRRLYPTHVLYVEAMVRATRRSVHRRFMTRTDGLDLLHRACRSGIPELGVTLPGDQPPVCTRLGQALPQR